MKPTGTSTSHHAERANTVLVVEDCTDTREVIVACAELFGFDVVAVANGREALERLRGGLRPGVIVLDIVMPEMDGLEFRVEQLADPTLSDIPIVVLSAANAADEKRARDLGLTTFLRKPIAFADLLRHLIGRPRRSPALA